VANNVDTGAPTVTASIYDPQVEFLEIGVNVNGAKAWKVYGPDLNGTYGGLQGTGGLEAVVMDAGGAATGILNDYFGNDVATISGGSVTWNTTKVGGYGPLPDSTAQPLTSITQLASAVAWRGHYIDPTGFYNLGARVYEPVSGRFLSPDPKGQAASMSLYDFCNGDPVNSFDPDGRGKLELTTNISFNDTGVGPNGSGSDWFSSYQITGNNGTSAPQIWLGNGFNLSLPGISQPESNSTATTSGGGIAPNSAGSGEGLELQHIIGVTAESTEVLTGPTLGYAEELNEAGRFLMQNGKDYSINFYGNQAAGYSAAEVEAAKDSTSTLAEVGSYVKWGGAAVGATVAGIDVYEGGGSNQSLVKGAVGLVGTGSAFIPVVGPFIAVGIGATNAAGGFNGLYNHFDNTPRFNQLHGAGGSW
jgi:RHS repeat-associated protein